MSVVYNGCKKQKRSVLMDISEFCGHFYTNITKASPELNIQQVREKIKFYVQTVFASPIELDDIIELIERYPRKNVANPRPMKRFTPEESAERRKKSEAVLECIIFDSCAEKEIKLHTPGYEANTTIPRTLQRLFRAETPGMTEEQKKQIADYNAEVVKLFDKQPQNKERNTKLLYDELRKDNPYLTDEQADKIIREKRRKIVLDSLKEVEDVPFRIDELTDENLSPEQLAKNYLLLERAVHISADAEDFAEFAPELYDLTQEEKDRFLELRDRSSIITEGIHRMRLIGNPAYEFLDPDIIDDYDLEDITLKGTEYDDNGFAKYDDLTEDAGIDKKKARDPDNFDEYSKRVSGNDVVSVFLEDANFRQSLKNTAKIERGVLACGLNIKGLKIEIEAKREDGGYTLQSLSTEKAAPYFDFDKTFIAELNGRRVPFQYKNGRFVIAQQPEKVFTDGIESVRRDITNELKELDPWYHSSSKVFKKMKNAFEEAKRYGNITKPGDYRNAYAYYRRLLDASDTYLATKPATGGNKWTQRHVKAGRMLKAFAEGRLEMLRRIEQMNATNVAGKTPAEIGKLIEADKRLKEKQELDNARKEDRNARMDNPVKWLADRIENFYEKVKLPENLSVEASNIRTSLKSINAADDKFSAENILATEVYAQTIGFMVLSELVMKEQGILKSDKVGPVAEAVGKMKTEDITKFGRQITLSLTGKDMIKGVVINKNNRGMAFSKSLSGAELENFLNSFDAHDIAEKVSYDIYKGQNITVAGQMAEAQYVDSVKPMRGPEADKYETALVDFAKKEIVDPINECFVKGEKSTAVNADLAHDVLRACVIHSIIQIERSKTGAQKVGNAESILIVNPDDAEQLNGAADIKKKINNSKTFNDMLGKFAGADGSISRERLEKILIDKEPQKVALDVVKVLAAEEQAKNAPANAPQKAEVRKADAPANAPKADAPKAAGKAPQA